MRPALADGYHQVIPATGASACSPTPVSRSPTSTATRSSNRRPTHHPAWPPASTTQRRDPFHRRRPRCWSRSDQSIGVSGVS